MGQRQMDKSKEYNRKNYLAHREERIKKASLWRKENPEKYKAQYKATYERIGKERARSQSRKPKGRFYSLTLQAKKRNLSIEIDLLTYSTLIRSRCHYCDGVLNETGSGLDRVDNGKGYSIDNVVPCCKRCNVMKNNFLTYDEMKVAMGAIRRYRFNQRMAQLEVLK
jgi:hypothetical protein